MSRSDDAFERLAEHSTALGEGLCGTEGPVWLHNGGEFIVFAIAREDWTKEAWPVLWEMAERWAPSEHLGPSLRLIRGGKPPGEAG